jgi:tetratricopeptide (TPR) repeat protein
MLPEGDNCSVAHFSDLRQALQPVERALSDHPTIIVLDNLESILLSTKSHEETRRDEDDLGISSCGLVDEIFALCRSLMQADGRTRLLFTTREPLPEPFNHRHREITLGALSREDAIELVGEMMRQEGLMPKHNDAGNTPQQIIDLVEAVNGHARALTLMAREISRSGVRATPENLRQLMAELDRRNPDDPEKSLFACVDLSFRRLTLEERALVMGLSMSCGGVHVRVLAHVAGVDVNAAETLSMALIEVGLGEYAGQGHICLHPALPFYLLERIGCEEEEQFKNRWAEEMQRLVDHLHWQQFKDSEISAYLTLLELPNLLQLLMWIQHKESPEKGILLACRVEQILSELGRPQELAQVIEVREEMVRSLEHWCHAKFEATCATIDRLLEQGDLQTAYIIAEKLRQNCLDAGEQAYPEAAFDLAMAYCKLGTALSAIGDAENALPYLAEAQQRFILIAEIDVSYARMIHVTTSEIGDCLKTLRLLDEAEATYQEAIRLAERECDKRAIAVSKGNWGYARMLQGDYDEAIRTFAEMLNFFAITNEPIGVAVGWHNTGIANRFAGRYQQAELAYKQSLAISVRLGRLESKASTLNELGVLYSELGYQEYGAVFSRQAADTYAALGNLQREGRARHNIGVTLARLNFFGEARCELHRAIVCKQPYGSAGQLWNTWSALHDLEQAAGNFQAAAAARQQAIESYRSYRCAGGPSMTPSAEFCAGTARAIVQNKIAKAEQELASYLQADIQPRYEALIAKLHAILRGARDPALAADPELSYDDVVELQLLLESLSAK